MAIENKPGTEQIIDKFENTINFEDWKSDIDNLTYSQRLNLEKCCDFIKETHGVDLKYSFSDFIAYNILIDFFGPQFKGEIAKEDFNVDMIKEKLTTFIESFQSTIYSARKQMPKTTLSVFFEMMRYLNKAQKNKKVPNISENFELYTENI